MQRHRGEDGGGVGQALGVKTAVMANRRATAKFVPRRTLIV